jgi:hypothetical protein
MNCSLCNVLGLPGAENVTNSKTDKNVCFHKADSIEKREKNKYSMFIWWKC